MKIEQLTTENMLDVLIYLFENHVHNNYVLEINAEKLVKKLQEKGFHQTLIKKAIIWLDKLAVSQQTIKHDHVTTPSQRVFCQEEIQKINTAARGLILHLEQIDFLTSETREIVISQIMELEQRCVDIEQAKWVILIVLFNQPNQQDALLCMEYLTSKDNIKEAN